MNMTVVNDLGSEIINMNSSSSPRNSVGDFSSKTYHDNVSAKEYPVKMKRCREEVN